MGRSRQSALPVNRAGLDEVNRAGLDQRCNDKDSKPQNAPSRLGSRPGFIRLLAAPRLEWGGLSWKLPAKAFALIALLSARSDYSMPRTQVRDILWGELDQCRANASMRQLIARVRAAGTEIGTDVLWTDWRSITLNSDEFEVDLAYILSIDVENAIDSRDFPVLERFISSFAGDLFSGLEVGEPAFEEWLSEVRDRLQRQSILALFALLGQTNGSDVQKRQRLANRLLRLDPAQEVGYRVLMETYAAQGERVLALQTYQKCCNFLRAELGVEPESSTRRLAAALGFSEAFSRRSIHAALSTDPASLRAERQQDDAGLPKVILLPPTVVSDDPTVNRIASALVDDVISGLARCRSFVVVAPHTGLRVSSLDMDGFGRKFNVRYSVSTMIKPTTAGSAATFRLSESETAVVLWSTEVGFSLRELPAAFELLSHRVIYSLADAIERAELRFPTAARDGTAYRMYLEGRANLSSSDLPNLRRARSWFRRSVARCENYAPALAGLSRTLSMERLVRGMIEDAPLEEALQLADLAVESDPFDGRGMRERGFSLLYLKRHSESIRCFEKASELNPNEADLFADYADALAHSGQPEKGRDMCIKAMNLNPFHPDYYNWILGSIYYQLENYEAAIEVLEPVKSHPGTARLLAACSAMAGHYAEARKYANIVRANYPDFRVEHLFRIVPDKYGSDTKHRLHGLRLAGLD